VLPSGENATPTHPLLPVPTLMVAETVWVEVSMTETEAELFATYTSEPSGLTAKPKHIQGFFAYPREKV
jgi:hypothetical protein